MRICALALLALVLTACGSSSTTRGSGNVVSVPRAVSPFSHLDFTGAAEVSVRVGGKTAVTIRGDDNIVPLITTDVRDGTLVISSRHGYSSKNTLRVEIVTPTLGSAVLSGAGSVTADGIHSQRFTADLRGAGRIELGGTTRSVGVSVNGVGSAELGSLVARDAIVDVNGTGSVHVYATGTLDATVNGVGSIRYSGKPATVHTSINGLGSVVAG